MTFSFSGGTPGLALDCFRLFWPRQGQHHFVAFKDLYKPLLLECYKGKSSKWIYESCGAWSQHIHNLGFADHVLTTAAGLSHEEAMKATDKFLPASCGSFVAVLALLVRWGTVSPQSGGFRQDKSRLQAKLLARGILESLCRVAGNWKLGLDVQRSGREWTCEWP